MTGVCKDYQFNPILKHQNSERFNMSKIQINNLQAAGSELFDGNESFLTELQATEASAIFGGKKNSKAKKLDKYAPAAPEQPVGVLVFVPVPVYYIPVPVATPVGYPCGCHA
jgi:hypothetical protein